MLFCAAAAKVEAHPRERGENVRAGERITF